MRGEVSRVVLPFSSAARAPTIYDVARAAGVSHQTVSRYLKGFEGIRPETAERVEQALKELDYRPNMAARSLATSRSHRIGALVSELLEVGLAKTIQGASDAARAAGFVLDIVTIDPRDDAAVDRALDLLRHQDLAAILALSPMDLLKDRIEAVNFPMPVLLEAQIDESAAQSHSSISDVGLRLLIDHLVELGHRRFVHVSGPLDWWASRHRAEAYEDALSAHGLTSVDSIAGSWTAASGFRAGMSMPLDRGITAVVAGNDQMALGILRALAERGVSVPGDVSVVGFDDIPESEYYQPPLTTVRIDYEQQGRILMGGLLSMLGPGEGAPVIPIVPPTLVVRASSSAAASASPRS